MSKYIPGNQKHLSRDDRKYIERSLNEGILTARNIDLKRKVKFKPHKVHKTQIKDRTVFEGRMYTDFQQLGLDHFAEMDTVHSSQDSKRVILTFFLTREKLFLAFVMNWSCKAGL